MWENLFALSISISGLFLFLYFVGNLQVSTQWPIFLLFSLLYFPLKWFKTGSCTIYDELRMFEIVQYTMNWECLREREREIEIFEWEMNRVKPQVYMDLGILIDRRGIERCWEQNLDRLRGIQEVLIAKGFNVSSFYRTNREFKNKARQIRLCIKRYREKPRKLR